MQVNILEAKNRLSYLIKSAQAGEEVVIANRGDPVARLVATQVPGVTQAAQAARAAVASLSPPPPNFVKWLQENPLPLHAQRSAQAIDAGIAEERNGWD
jgi:prevent-host-death family protein